MNGEPSAGFAMLVPARPGARVAEISDGDAFAAEVLRRAGCLVTCVRRSEESAAGVRAAGFPAEVGRGDDLAGLHGSFDVVLLSIALGRGQGPERRVRNLRAIARAAAAHLVPAGRLTLMLPNPIYSFPPRLAGAPLLHRILADEGFGSVESYAVLPSVRRCRFLVPLAGTAGAELFFRALVPRSRSAARRFAVRLAAAAANHGLLAVGAPAIGVVAERAAGH